MTDLAFCELPFLNQSVVEAGSSKLLHKPTSGAYRERNAEPRQHRIHQEHSGPIPGVEPALQTMSPSIASRSSNRFEEPNTSFDKRPKRPKRVNVENFVAPRQSARVPLSSSKQRSGARSTEQTTVPVHRVQGLSLESRDVSSSPTVNHSRQATGETASRSSRIPSNVAESGPQVSSLTGLSAGSLARRRLLRRMDRVAEPLAPRSPGEELQRELRAFRSAENTATQTHGPSAKYGFATVAPRSSGPIPDIPKPEQRHRPSVQSPATYHPGFTSSLQAVNRSPDWFASNESFATDTFSRNFQLYAPPSRHTTSRDVYPPARDLQPQSSNHFSQPVDRISDYGLTASSPNYPSVLVQPTYPPVSHPQIHRPGYDRETLYYQDACASDGFIAQSQPAGHDLNHNVPPPNYRWELVEVPQPHPTTPQLWPSSPHMSIAGPIIEQRPPIYHQEPDQTPYMEDPAPFQKGRTDLYGYVPTSSPAHFQPLRGFWQRNYL